MRKISLFLLLVSLFVFFSSSLSAAPPTQSICEDLKAEGVTQGLFGLCVAYCEAGANSERVLENYNLKKKDSDPAMPCLDTQEPVLDCACWDTLTASQVGEGMYPSSCTLDPSSQYVLFYDEGPAGADPLTEIFSVSAGACSYLNFNSVTLDFKSLALDEGQENVCRVEILALAETDFSGIEFDCLPLPPLDPAP